ncbi:glycosyltransferase family 2 protein, partial [Streptomyces sp. NPDC056728]
MTMFSVVVTALDAQGYLRECLESALNGAAADTEVEVVVVDNASTDASRAIIDEYAERDERVRAVCLPRRLPAGAARVAGAQQVGGDYVLFLEGHDSLMPDALVALARRAEEAGRPDVIVFDHVRSTWSDSAIGSGDGRLFIAPGSEVFTIETQQKTLNLTPTLANRVLRADFYAAHQELFGQDEYTEVLPAIGSLLAAERIAITDAVLIRRNAREVPLGEEGHFNLFPQYEALWKLLGSGPAMAEAARIVFSGMVRRYLKVLTLPGASDRHQAKFFHCASAHFLRYKPADYQRPANLNGVRHAMLERDSYSGYRALQLANRKRRSVRTLAAKARKKAAEVAKEGAYREQLRHPIEEDLAVFSAYWD